MNKEKHQFEYRYEFRYNYKMPSLNASLGIFQLENLKKNISKKRKNFFIKKFKKLKVYKC